MNALYDIQKLNRTLRHLNQWVSEVVDIRRFYFGITGYLRYFYEWLCYSKLPGAEPIRLKNAFPCLHERTSTTAFDPHYFFVNNWAIRRVLKQNPSCHIDIGSQFIFASMLAAVVPVIFLDYRPLEVSLDGFESKKGDILSLPFESKTVKSLSCLHVAEHIGLGRYGDPLNPLGTRKAAQELSRVLAPGGKLYFALPVGRERLCFNAHRIHSPKTILEYFSELKLIEFSGVTDSGKYIEHIQPIEFEDSSYACGFMIFTREK